MFMKSSAFFAGLLGTAHAYDVGCLWPSRAPDDAVTARNVIVFQTANTLDGMTETPYVIHTAHAVTMCQAMCVSYHTPGMLDPLLMEPTRFTVPDYGRNAYSILMCMSQCNQWVVEDEAYYNVMKVNNGFDVEWIESDSQKEIRDATDSCPNDQRSCLGGCGAICGIIRGSGFNPYTVGSYLGVLVRNYFDNDGFNRLGDMTYSRTAGGPIPCTASCRKHQDTSGYAPRPNPRNFPEDNPDTDKYACTGDCRRWQPLQEGDFYGSLVQQEFVAAHIGEYARTYLRNATISLEDPGYDLYTQSLDVIEEVKMTSSDQYKKDAIAMMDDKLKVRRAIQDEVIAEVYNSGEMSFQEYTMYLIGISTAELDGLVQAWKEKRHHDLVRPTTVIKHWDDDILNTFSGVRSDDGPVDIAARDFEAFIRVMPHPEFPSGSSCLCTTYQEYTDKWMMDRYNRTITNFGSFYNDIVFEDMMDLREICGQSRVWGGMHYPESIPAGEQACTGLGELGVAYSNSIRNGATFPNEYFKGDPVPSCPAR